MNQNIIDLSGNAEFQLRVRQAIFAAQHSARQVALLLIAFDRSVDPMVELGHLTTSFTTEILARLRSTLRESDTIVLVEQGQMAILLPSVGGADDAALVTGKLLAKLEAPIHLEGLIVKVQPRIGIALFPEHGNSATMLMKCADSALAIAKRTSNRCILYSEQHKHGLTKKLGMTELRQAIVADQLFVVYQPKINLRKGEVAGVEALTRWRHPDLGVIVPDEFIPVAERTGLIIPLTLWVLHQALFQCKQWLKLGYSIPVAVNLSMWNLEAQELPDQVNGLLTTTSVPPELLICEITESTIMGDPQRIMETLEKIRSLGVAFAIDDFGVGYSSLSYLKKLPVGSIKIDKSFVQNIDSDRDNAVIVRSIIDLGHNLDLKVTAEGVETPQAVEILQAYGCDEGQGYLFGRPIIGDLMTRYIEKPPFSVKKETYLIGDDYKIDPLADTTTEPNNNL